MESTAARIGRRRRRLGAAAAAAFAIAALAAPADAQALNGDDDDDPPGLHCVAEAHGSLSVSPAVVNPGQLVTLSWNVQAPSGCGALSVTVDYLGAPRSGSRAVDPIATRSYGLRVAHTGATRTIATAVATVQLLTDPNGRPTVTLTGNHQVPLLVQALATPHARVFVQNHLELDLSGRHDINLATGVHLIGGRTSRQPGPLLFVPCEPNRVLFCQSAPRILFLINGEHSSGVRITGVRIAGPDQERAKTGIQTFGIRVLSAVDVEIDNNELSGWRGTAVDVRDPSSPALPVGRVCHAKDPLCTVPNATTIRIHDNYFHHNQREGGDGYGVATSDGAYALIERNVFDWNRHAIASDGDPGSGYLAYRNLVLEHGGYHNDYVHYHAYTHQFDMHGTETCFLQGEFSCGDAGEYMDIRFNSFFYTANNAIKLRGTPKFEADVVSNVFAHTLIFGVGEALSGYVSEMHIEDNLVGINENGNFGHCDFDRDFIADEFLATGQTWWFRSGAGDARHWRFLNTSKARLSDIQLGDVDGDGRCDVVADGVVSSGGTGRATARITDLIVKAANGTLAAWEMNGGTVATEHTIGSVPTGWQLVGLADVTGDGEADLVWRDEGGRSAVWAMARGARIAEASADADGYTYQGSGDFDADGVDDLLWRDAAGQLAIWFAGQRHDTTPDYRAGRRTAYPGYANVPAPVDLAWKVQGVGDFDGDGRADILWRDKSGALWVWHMAGGLRVGEMRDAGLAGALVQAVADFDADGRADILWRDRAGDLAVWFGGRPEDSRSIALRRGAVVPSDWQWTVVDARDFDRDGRADLLWQDASGRLVVWIIVGERVVREEIPRQPLGDWTFASQSRVTR